MGAAEGGRDRGTATTPEPAPDRPRSAAPAEPSEPGDQLAQLTAADERERVSRDLHDLVLQRLFGLAATLSALSTSTSDARAAERLATCVDDLDQTIRAIRDGILHQEPLHTEPSECPPCPPDAVVTLARAVVAETASGNRWAEEAAVGDAPVAETIVGGLQG